MPHARGVVVEVHGGVVVGVVVLVSAASAAAHEEDEEGEDCGASDGDAGPRSDGEAADLSLVVVGVSAADRFFDRGHDFG